LFGLLIFVIYVINSKHYSKILYYTAEQGVELQYRLALSIDYSVEPKIRIQRKEDAFIENNNHWSFDIIAVSYM
jgi:hypothetical protein